MQQEIEQLNTKVAELEAVIDSLRAVATVPLDIADAINLRSDKSKLETSTAAAQLVNVPGTGNVAGPMVGFLTTTINGTAYKIPYYS